MLRLSVLDVIDSVVDFTWSWICLSVNTESL